jgi:hypothetical protein
MKRNIKQAGNDHPRFSVSTIRGAVCLLGMLREETWSFPKWPRRSDGVVMKTLGNTANNVSRTIKVNEHQVMSRRRPAVVQRSAPRLIAEWQQRGPETLSGHALRNLRLALAPPQCVTAASAS